MTDIKLEGLGPFHLPVLQSVRASGDSTTVSITVTVLDKDDLKNIVLRMPQSLADVLADQIAYARSKRRPA